MSLILASTSFRRQQLLRWLGVEFQSVSPDFDEDSLQRSAFPSTRAFVETLSLGKAMSVSLSYSNDIILGGDTLVDIDGMAIGKPKDLDDARLTLRLLSGKTHRVYSGVTCISHSHHFQKVVSDCTAVTFKQLSDQEIEAYVQTGIPVGKAGSYALQEGASEFVEKLDGSVTNVLGLPVLTVTPLLSEIGISINQELLRKRIDSYLSFNFPHEL